MMPYMPYNIRARMYVKRAQALFYELEDRDRKNSICVMKKDIGGRHEVLATILRVPQ